MATGEVHAGGPVLPTTPPARAALVAAFVGVDLVVAGVCIAVWGGQGTEVGWFAYSGPSLATTTFWILTPWRAAGFALVAVGLVVMAAALGYRAGLIRRR